MICTSPCTISGLDPGTEYQLTLVQPSTVEVLLDVMEIQPPLGILAGEYIRMVICL